MLGYAVVSFLPYCADSWTGFLNSPSFRNRYVYLLIVAGLIGGGIGLLIAIRRPASEAIAIKIATLVGALVGVVNWIKDLYMTVQEF